MKKKHVFMGILLYTIILYFVISLFVNYITNSTKNSIENKKDPNSIYSSDLYELQSEKVNNYDIHVDFNPDKKTYYARQTTTYTNDTNQILDEIYFHIYPNAFKSKSSTPYIADEFGSLYPMGFDDGFINFSKIEIDGKKISYDIISDDTILLIELDEPLNKHGRVNIYMEYEVKIPNAFGRFGYGKDTFNFGNWYPVISVYDEHGWNIDPFYKLGDPFYSSISNYQITINAPSDYILASSGNIVSQETNKSTKTWKIEGTLLRDFAMSLSKDFIMIEDNIDGILIKGYFLTNDSAINNSVMNSIVNSIHTFNDIFGKYPYEQFTVVSSNITGAMEYPNFIFINEKFYNDYFLNRLQRIVVHEVAHQWWYSVVGNNQIKEAWLDEGLATFSEYLFNSIYFGDKAGTDYFNRYIKNYYEYKKEDIKDKSIIKSIYEFENKSDYSAVVYKRSALFLYELEQKYGQDVILEILKNYYNKYKFKNSTSYDLIYLIENITNDNLIEFSNKWLYDK